jgi:hypothetical protein
LNTAFIAQAAPEDDMYNDTDVAVINYLIENSDLGWTVDDSGSWPAFTVEDIGVRSSVQWMWNDDESELHIQVLCLSDITLETEELDLSDLDYMGWVYLYGNSIPSLDFHGLTNLTYTLASLNSLTSVNFSGCSKLNYADVSSNPLTSIDYDGCSNLQSLLLAETQLTAIDATGLTALTKLVAHSNPFTSMDLSGLTNLADLDASSSTLTSVNLSGCSALERVRLDQNKLTDIDLSGCSALTELNLAHNELIAIDLSDSTALTELGISNNKLAAIDLSGCDALTSVDVTLNKLAAIDLSGLALETWGGSYQSVELTLTEKGDVYSLDIELNDPNFNNPAITYENGVLSSSDNTVLSERFSAKTGAGSMEITGTMTFTYEDAPAVSSGSSSSTGRAVVRNETAQAPVVTAPPADSTPVGNGSAEDAFSTDIPETEPPEETQTADEKGMNIWFIILAVRIVVLAGAALLLYTRRKNNE